MPLRITRVCNNCAHWGVPTINMKGKRGPIKEASCEMDAKKVKESDHTCGWFVQKDKLKWG